jgi:alkylation response protein AidB-like acyl-CoA dehydrogenase
VDLILGSKKRNGIRGSDTHSLMFNDVKSSKENRIGEDGFDLFCTVECLNGGRIGIASQALGINRSYEIVAHSLEKSIW